MITLPENPMRSRVRELIEAEPGICGIDLLRRLKSTPEFAASAGNGALHWHLRQLEHAGKVASHRSGRYRRYYPMDGVWRPDVRALAAVHGHGRQRLVQALVAAGGLTTNEVRQRLGPALALSALRYHLRRLHDAGLLVTEPIGRNKRHVPTSRLRSVFTEIVVISPTVTVPRAAPTLTPVLGASSPEHGHPVLPCLEETTRVST